MEREQIMSMPREEAAKLFRKKQLDCKTCAEQVKMSYTDQEYIMLKERLMKPRDDDK